MENTEIERKFLVRKENLPDLSKHYREEIVQGYAKNFGGSYIYRLRKESQILSSGKKIGYKFFQTIKGIGNKLRKEYEIEIEKEQYNILKNLCDEIVVYKTRYEIFDGNKYLSLDVYHNNLEGLYTVEVEFETEEECDAYIPPSWFGMEVTEEVRYSNYVLAISGIPEEYIGHVSQDVR